MPVLLTCVVPIMRPFTSSKSCASGAARPFTTTFPGSIGPSNRFSGSMTTGTSGVLVAAVAEFWAKAVTAGPVTVPVIPPTIPPEAVTVAVTVAAVAVGEPATPAI